MNYKLINTLLFSVATIGIFSGCGKHEESSGFLGAASGSAVGASVTGGKSKRSGAFIGGLVGNIIGRSIGKEADKHEAEAEHLRREREYAHQKRINDLKHENRRLCKATKKWCVGCHEQVNIAGALRCPDCGDPLVREKRCSDCARSFAPGSSYRYCAYCPERVLLSYR